MAKNAHPVKPTFSSLVAHWLVCGLLGMLIPCLLYYIIQSNSFEQWQMLSPTPPGAVEVLDGDPYAVTVRTADGQTLEWNTHNQRWVPAVSWEDPRVTMQPCDHYPAALKASANPPEAMLTCTAFDGFMTEITFTVLVAIDQQGNVWKWDQPDSSFAGVIYFLLAIPGGIVGVIVGSLIWLARRGVAGRRQGKAPAQPAETTDIASQPAAPQKRSRLWMLALAPVVLCVGVYLVALVIDLSREAQRENRPEPTTLPGVSAFYTQEAAWFSAPPATPNPAGPAYDFAAQCPGAQWTFSILDTWRCGDNRAPDQASVSVLEEPQEGQEWSGQALRLYIPVGQREVSGRYPTWFIRPGEHFRATLVCPAENAACNLTFTLYLEQRDGERIDLGTWLLTDEQRSQEIDVDLSEFAGKIVSVVLKTINSDPGAVEQVMPQIALWVNPRIE